MHNSEDIIYQRIKEFEIKSNIEKFITKEGNLWPIFKILLFRCLNNPPKNIKKRNSLYRALSKLKEHIYSIKNYKFKKFISLVNDDTTEEIWFSNHELRYENDLMYNKYLDPFFIELSNKRALMYEWTNKFPFEFSFSHLSKKRNILNIFPVILKRNNKNVVTKLFSFYKNEYEEFQEKEFVKLLKKEFPDCDPYLFFLEYTSFYEYFNFYVWFFSKYPKLKKVYLVAYYMTSRMAMFAAAKKYNIETVDIQHNVMSKRHFAYGAWNYIQKDGYELLPNIFYVFSEKEKSLLDDIFKKEHKVVVVDNITFKTWTHKNKTKQKQEKNKILVTLQNEIILKDNFLIKGLLQIQKERKDIKLVFRLHPRHTYIKNDIEKELKKVELVYFWDNNSDIYDTLTETLVNITSFSSVVNDALLFNIPSIIYTKKGTIVFQNELKNNKNVNSALNLKEFLITINKYIK